MQFQEEENVKYYDFGEDMFQCKEETTKLLWRKLYGAAQKKYKSGKSILNVHKNYVKSILNLY